MSINYRIAQWDDKDKWDSFVDSHPTSVPYHLFAWGASVQQAYGFKFYPLIAEKRGDILGILPVVEIKKPLGRPEFCSLPYCDLGGVLALDSSVGNGLLQFVAEELTSQCDYQLHLRFNQEFVTNSSSIRLHSVQLDKVRMVLDLPDTAEILWKSFKSKLRSQVNKAVKNGLDFRLGVDGLEDFYCVYARNMRDLGSPSHSFLWFKSIVHNYGNRAQVGVVYSQNVPVGGGIILSTRNTVSIPWASTIREYNKLSPNMLLYWKLLEYASTGDCVKFDFGRSSLNSGTYKFKAQWGAQPRQLFWYENGKPDEEKKNVKKQTIVNRELAATIWRHLPVWFATALGARLRKYISL